MSCVKKQLIARTTELETDAYLALDELTSKVHTLCSSFRFDSSSFKYSGSDSFNEALDSFFPRIPSNIQLLLQIRHSASASSFEFI
jgi:hypothetical protein